MLLGAFLLAVLAAGTESGQGESSTALPPQITSQPAGANPVPPGSAARQSTYSLTPERRAQAIAYSRQEYFLYFAGTLFSIGIYLFLWRARIAVTSPSFAGDLYGSGTTG